MQAESSGMNGLSDPERAIMRLVCRGLRNSEIAGVVGITERTVKWHMSRLFKRFDVTNRTELVGMLTANGIKEYLDVPPGSTQRSASA